MRLCASPVDKHPKPCHPAPEQRIRQADLPAPAARHAAVIPDMVTAVEQQTACALDDRDGRASSKRLHRQTCPDAADTVKRGCAQPAGKRHGRMRPAAAEQLQQGIACSADQKRFKQKYHLAVSVPGSGTKLAQPGRGMAGAAFYVIRRRSSSGRLRQESKKRLTRDDNHDTL